MRICLKIEMRRGMSVHMRDCTGTLRKTPTRPKPAIFMG